MTAGRPRKYDSKCVNLGATVPIDLSLELDIEIKNSALTKSEYITTILMQRNPNSAQKQLEETKNLKAELSLYKEQNKELSKRIEEMTTQLERQNNALEGVGQKVESGNIFVKKIDIPIVAEFINSKESEISQKMKRITDRGETPLMHIEGLTSSYYMDFKKEQEDKGNVIDRNAENSVIMAMKQEILKKIGR